MKLAINGGKKVRTKKFPAYRTVGKEEEKAVLRVLRSGVLSRFLGTWHEDFYGGPEVRAFEREWAKYYGVKYVVSVNSATAALYAAVGASGIEPGEEVIVSPYTMCASATAAVVYGAIPVFADIEPDYFCLDPKSIEERITDKTRAIIVVDIFGQVYDVEAINKLARKHNLVVIEDCAQAPGVKYKGKYAGTFGDIGVFSLNYHKHVHTGEGGMVVTNNKKYAEKLQLIRNHGEAVVEGKGVRDLSNMVGFNYRMTELEAAIGRIQLKKVKKLITVRRKNVEYLNDKLKKIPGIKPVKIRSGAEHAYYLQPLLFDQKEVGMERNKFIEAVKAELPVTELRETEGVKISSGYVKPLYMLPMYQQKIAFGSKGYPWTSFENGKKIQYKKGLCPVAEKLYSEELFYHELMRPPMTKADLDDVVAAFEKVWQNRKELE